MCCRFLHPFGTVYLQHGFTKVAHFSIDVVPHCSAPLTKSDMSSLLVKESFLGATSTRFTSGTNVPLQNSPIVCETRSQVDQ